VPDISPMVTAGIDFATRATGPPGDKSLSGYQKKNCSTTSTDRFKDEADATEWLDARRTRRGVADSITTAAWICSWPTPIPSRTVPQRDDEESLAQFLLEGTNRTVPRWARRCDDRRGGRCWLRQRRERFARRARREFTRAGRIERIERVEIATGLSLRFSS